MNTSVRSLLASTSLVFALAGLSTRANADTFVDPVDVITVSAPSVKYEDIDLWTGVPRTETKIVAHVKTDPVVLTTYSGVALFKDSVREAARKVCGADDPHGEVDVGCVRVALKGAKPQVDAIIAAAQMKSASNG